MKVDRGNLKHHRLNLESSTACSRLSGRQAPRADLACCSILIRQQTGRERGKVGVMVASVRKRVRFDLDLLDPEDPFEVDGGNKVHLFKHLPSDDGGKPVTVDPEDALDVYIYGDPDYYPADEGGQADWLMVGMVPGLLLCIPLAPPKSGDVRFCRPIGIYTPSREDRNRYLRGQADE